jgi:hypothetical protein
MTTSTESMTSRDSSNPSPACSKGNPPPLLWSGMEGPALDRTAETSPGASTAAEETAGRPAGRQAERESVVGILTSTVIAILRTIGAGLRRLLPFKVTSKDMHAMSVTGQVPTLSIRASAVNS